MMILSIDQSLNCSGVFVWNKDGSFFPHVIKPKDKKAEQIVKIRDTITELSRLIYRYDIRHIVVESLPYGVNSTSVRPLAALYYFIHNLCIDKGITFSEEVVTSVKKFATGKGNAKKIDMINAFQEAEGKLFDELWDKGLKKTTGMADMADAYFIGKLYRSKYEKDHE